LNKGPTS